MNGDSAVSINNIIIYVLKIEWSQFNNISLLGKQRAPSGSVPGFGKDSF